MWKCATPEPRMWPAFWKVSRMSGAMSVVSPYLSGIVFATAFRMWLESYAGLRAPPLAALMKSSWRSDIRSPVGAVVYTGPSYPDLKRGGASPEGARGGGGSPEGLSEREGGGSCACR